MRVIAASMPLETSNTSSCSYIGSPADASEIDGVFVAVWRRAAENRKRADIKFINVPFYNYLDLMCQSSSIFGVENVHFIVSENLRKHPAHEIDSLTNFLGVESMEPQFSSRPGEKTENVQRNQSFYEEVRSDYVSSGKRREVFEHFKFSNKLLSESKQLDLGAHGYY